MSFTTYVVVLGIGGVLIGALSGMLMPRARTGGLTTAVGVGLAFTVVVGIFITEFFETQTTVGLPVALALAPLYIYAPSRSGGGGSWGPWSGGDSGGSSAECGGSDGGGGDGGGCD